MQSSLRTNFLLLFLFAGGTLFSQKLLKGVVLDAEKGIPVPKASVFLNNTSIGTTANEQGQFQLAIPAGRFELIVSSIGHQTANQTITAHEVADFLTIKLQTKSNALEEVVIEPFEKDGWQKWGTWFIENFIGTSAYARDTRLKNPEVLKFRNSKKTNELKVIALAPLIIENKALGYRLTYQLEDFRYHFRTRYLFYAGYPFFENLRGSDRKQRRWEMAREEVYNGSMLQFMRALFRNRILEEGFEVRRLQKLPNDEKKRVQRLYYNNVTVGARSTTVLSAPRDSTAYYNDVLRQDDYRPVIGRYLLPGDSIAYAVDSITAGCYFPHYLHISYRGKAAAKEYLQQYPETRGSISSEITLLNNQPLTVHANGAYFDPQELLSTGWWAWWEKIGTLLPFDYWPEKRPNN